MKKTKIKKDLFNRIKEIGSGNKIRGITLISLVITIIVLLILAGITIAQLSGNGLFEKAKIAKEEYQNAQDDENDKIAKYNNEIDSYVGGNRGTVTLTEEEYEIFKNQTDYSSDEKRIGTWINNKPLYRKTITIESATIPSNSEYKVVDTASILDKSNIRVVNFYGGYYADYGGADSQFHRWTYESNNYSYAAYYRQGADAIRVCGSWGGLQYTIKNLVFNIEYIKLSD